ncbi:MAG: DUF4276 family protein, partial [Proteobacteria bacterium]|nr:DUF4276 family protein [Pseudomonadota bacterium]
MKRLLAQYRGDEFLFTTLLDYYGLPADFPLRVNPLPGIVTPLAKAQAIENAWKEDIGDFRFLPNLLLHEYETLILAEPESLLAAYPEMEEAIAELRQDIAG